MTAPRWLAGPDRTAHLHLARVRATACGAPPIGERFAWPATRRCPACVSRADGGPIFEWQDG